MVDFYEYSTPELVRLLGNRFKEYRIRCNLTQKDVSEQSGIGLTTIHKFENGKMFLSNPVLDLQPSTNSRMVQLAIFHCQHLLCC